MSHADLLQALTTVRRELESAEDLDPAEVDKLRQTVHDIEAVLKRQSDPAPSIGHRLSESATHFEQTHPRLTLTIGRIADMLQQMGI